MRGYEDRGAFAAVADTEFRIPMRGYEADIAVFDASLGAGSESP